ncbi:MAG: sn-glycerol-3-phosphate-binding periplasmic protein UgpB [Chlamydiia bacterium]|nr:sn-glycerol-3-phosphate-binding periplasmic protein UgpB [Chlamydiia bacterium]
MRNFLFTLVILTGFISNAYTKEIQLWHAFEGFLAKVFTEIVDDFNHSSSSCKIVPIYKGNYKETLNKGLEAFDNGEHPHILQVYEVATLTMMLSDGYFFPVDSLMKRYQKKFDSGVYIDSIRKFYSAPSGKMLSLPWNASTGILFYNKRAFEKAGLDPHTPPRTWVELEEMSEKLVAAGYKGFTTAWPAAYHLEHFSCWHNLPISTYRNGFGGLSARFIFNDKERNFHVSKLSNWEKEGVFSYAGRYTNEPEDMFAKEECAILLQGANRLPLLKAKADFEIGVGYMPYWPEIAENPYNLNIGGASFWVLNGFSEEEYRGVVQFFQYLSSPEIQAFWHQMTGYLPVTEAAYYLSKKKGYYVEHPASEIAVLEVMKNEPTEYSYGVRFGDYVYIREDIIVDELEKAFSGQKSSQEALNDAVERGNKRLEAFERANTRVPLAN